MGSKSDYAEKVVLDALLGQVSLPALPNLWVALYTTGTLTDASTGSSPVAVEVTGGGYARVKISNDLSTWPAASGTSPSTKTNGIPIAWAAATASWGTVTQWALCDAPTGGNIIYYGSFATPTTIAFGDQASLPAGSLKVQED